VPLEWHISLDWADRCRLVVTRKELDVFQATRASEVGPTIVREQDALSLYLFAFPRLAPSIQPAKQRVTVVSILERMERTEQVATTKQTASIGMKQGLTLSLYSPVPVVYAAQPVHATLRILPCCSRPEPACYMTIIGPPTYREVSRDDRGSSQGICRCSRNRNGVSSEREKKTPPPDPFRWTR